MFQSEKQTIESIYHLSKSDEYPPKEAVGAEWRVKIHTNTDLQHHRRRRQGENNYHKLSDV